MKKIYYLLSSFIISIILLFGIQNKVFATSVSINASGKSIEKGQTITLNADIKDASSWQLDLSTTGGSLSKYDSRVGNTDSGNNESKTVKIGTFSANEAGTYTITLSGYVVDGVSLSRVSASGNVKITVTDPAPPPAQTQTPTQPQQPEQPQQPQTPVVEETPKFTNTNKTMYASKDNMNLRATWSTSSAATTVNKGTELTVTGTSTNKVNNYVWYRVKYNGKTLYVASNLLTATKPEEQLTEQPTEQPTEDEPLEVQNEDETSGIGEEANNGLKTLQIEGLTLSPSFNPNIYEYRVIVKKDINELPIKAIPALEGATVTIAGNDLQEGENLITILVYNENNDPVTYQITTNKNTLNLAETDKMLSEGTLQAKRNVIIFISTLGGGIVALIILMIIKNKTINNEYEDERIEEQFTNKEESVENTQAETVQEEIIQDKKEKKKGKHF